MFFLLEAVSLGITVGNRLLPTALGYEKHTNVCMDSYDMRLFKGV